MGINAVKGSGDWSRFDSVSQLGSEHSDEIFPDGFGSNNAGGVLGGISSGQDLVVRIAIKPTSSIRKNRNTVDKDGRRQRSVLREGMTHASELELLPSVRR